MNSTNRLKKLYESYKSREITSSEFDELVSFINNESASEDEFVRMIEKDLADNVSHAEDPIVKRIIINSEAHIIERISPAPARVRKIKSLSYIVAASIIIIVSASILYFKKAHQNFDEPTISNVIKIDDVAPGGNKAILKISDGRDYVLDGASSQISINDNVVLLNDGNKLSELPGSTVDLELSTPRKGNYQAVLPDGTKVWLNAESKIIYPSKFTTTNRVVKVDGEVYLEVAKVKNSSFIVELSDGRRIEVLGTKFNVNAYSNQDYIKTSLLEGRVKLSNKYAKSAILTPGHKAILSNSMNSILISETNINNDLAWLDNKFNFEDLSFDEIMQQIVRWYDVDVVYKSKIPNIEFYGELDKNNSLRYVIDAFKLSGVNMKIKNKTLTIE